MTDLAELAWPSEQVGEATVELGRSARLFVGAPEVWARLHPGDDAALRASQSAARAAGFVVEPIVSSASDLADALRNLGPALVALPDQDTPNGAGYLAIRSSRGRRLRVLTPEGRTRSVPIARVAGALTAPLRAELRQGPLAGLLAEAGLSGARMDHALERLLLHDHAETPIGPFLALRPGFDAPLGALLRRARLPQLAVALLLGHALTLGLTMVGWYALGRAALYAGFDTAEVTAWALALALGVPLTAWTLWLEGELAIVTGRVLKQRLLDGSLRLPLDHARTHGAGHFFGQVLEAGALERALLGGAIGATLALLDLLGAGLVLITVRGGWLPALLLLACVVVTGALFALQSRRARKWTRSRLDLTADLVERMVGHRTRLAQQSPTRWHLGEDSKVDGYLDTSRRLDSVTVTATLVPAAWALIGVLPLGLAVAAGEAPATLAVLLGGVLLAGQGFVTWMASSDLLAAASASLGELRPLLEAAAAPLHLGYPEPVSDAPDGKDERPILESRQVTYRYPGRERWTLRGCDLQLRAGDRVLLEGASGSGKSTLGAVLAGLRPPTSGLLLADGLDLGVLGETGWRERVLLVPQFHENHVFSASFAFNALLGGRWPPSAEDMEALEDVLEALGLGELLARMPSRTNQMVGDQGWRLSHGEQSRLFLARALLTPRARVWLLDETFGALDPQTLERCVTVVRERAPALLVIAHP